MAGGKQKRTSAGDADTTQSSKRSKPSKKVGNPDMGQPSNDAKVAQPLRRSTRSKCISSADSAQSLSMQNTAKIHSMIRREKRGWCAFCSSKRYNLVLEQAIQNKVVRKRSIYTGCKECNVALCTQKTDFWERWHSW